MSRRSTPHRVDAARRAATLNRLVGEGVSVPTAKAWMEAWQAQATRDGLERGSAYLQAGWDWVAEQRAQGKRAA